ncbi:HEXXH motif domain-containing protein [Dactylosporangium sp. NPDC049525]|uniref:HEXXH motif domain-containing protein n=1 Tax=Dactylosporangium sp. NPDC049525 TaxID=3154730 RepID=UPI0034403622
MSTNDYHQLPAELLSDLAESTGGPAASRALAEAQLSKHLLRIAHLLRQWPGPTGERDRLVEAIEAARSAAPDAAGRVLGAPLVGAWVAIACRAAGQGLAEPADVRHLGAVAAVACAAAGVDVEVEAPVRDGTVALPGLGLLTVGDAETARVRTAGGTITVDAGHGPRTVPTSALQPDGDLTAGQAGDGPGWQPVRFLRATAGGIGIKLALDDVDPYRHGYHAPPAPRLSEAEFAVWQELFGQAWRLLAERIPGRAAEIAAGLRALVPLRADDNSSRSATIRHVFGVFGLTRPTTAADFAVTLVHEYQHSKLSALLDVTPLSDPDDERRYFAPWRTDPRPLGGLLQGVYAFVGVADTWRALRGVDGVTDAAEQEFADARLQVDRSLLSVESSDALTPAGKVFVGHLRQFADALLTVPVDETVAQRAEQRQRELHQRWLAANST